MHERWRGTGPRPTVTHAVFSESFLGPTDLKRTRDVFSGARTMARDRPSPYGEGVAFFFVARGPVPRELHRHDVCFPICSLCSPDHKQVKIAWQMPELQAILTYRARHTHAGDRQVFPPPYGEGGGVFFRSAGACPLRALDCACTHDGEGNSYQDAGGRADTDL